LIDESEMTLELMQERLVAEGADVRIAVALGEVDSIVANWCPNLVVANVKRADLAGDALCARLKHAVGSSELRILLCSTLPDAELRLLAMAAGADGFVSKSRGLDSFVREVVEMTMKLSPPNMAMGRVRQA
jgi:DNA-binding response OmpR family regulator